jgi:hypothetical protein
MSVPSPHPSDKLLIAYLDGEATEGETISTHCDQCEPCRQRLGAFQMVDQLIDNTKTEEQSRTVWFDVKETIAAESRPFFTPVLTAGAAAALCIGLFLGLSLERAPQIEITTKTSIWSTVGSSIASSQYESWPALFTDSDLSEGE